jgi:hypothetical protein
MQSSDFFCFLSVLTKTFYCNILFIFYEVSLILIRLLVVGVHYLTTLCLSYLFSVVELE